MILILLKQDFDQFYSKNVSFFSDIYIEQNGKVKRHFADGVNGKGIKQCRN